MLKALCELFPEFYAADAAENIAAHPRYSELENTGHGETQGVGLRTKWMLPGGKDCRSDCCGCALLWWWLGGGDGHKSHPIQPEHTGASSAFFLTLEFMPVAAPADRRLPLLLPSQQRRLQFSQGFRPAPANRQLPRLSCAARWPSDSRHSRL